MKNPFARRAQQEADLDAEIAAHLQMAIAERVARGQTPRDAAEAVRREFGCPVLVKEVTRSMWRGARLQQLLFDFCIALRTLWRTPRFSVAAIVCLAIGVGATTTVFSALHAILVQPLPYPNAESLVSVRPLNLKGGALGASVTPGEVELWQQSKTLTAISAWRSRSVDLAGSEDLPERVEAAEVTNQLVPLLGVQPLHGRLFALNEHTEGRNQVVMLSYELWQRRFGSDVSVVGKNIQLNGNSYQVVGIMPRAFSFPEGAKLWTPLVPPKLPPTILFYHGVLGQLREGTSITAAQHEFAQFDRKLQKSPDYADWSTLVRTLRNDLVGALRTPIFLFQAAALLVLVIACANVSALLLARGLFREQEMNVRSALGAGRGQLVGHVLVECFALAFIGGLLGTAIAFAGVRLISLAFPAGVPSYLDLSVSGTTLLLSLAVSALAAVACGLAPAIRAGTMRGGSRLHGSSRTGDGASVRRKSYLNILVSAQLAIAVLLVMGAALLTTTHSQLRRSLGFKADGLLSLQLQLPRNRYPAADQQESFFRDVESRFRAMPGVSEVSSAISAVPLDGIGNGVWNFRLPTQPPGIGVEHQQTTITYVGLGYLRTLGVPLLRGRRLEKSHVRGERAAVVNEVFAKRYFPGRDALNQLVLLHSTDSTTLAPIRVVGVVGNFRDERPPAEIKPALYLSDISGAPSRTFLLRTRLDNPSSLAPAIRTIVRDLDPQLVAAKLQTQMHVVNRTFWRERLAGQVFAVFASLAVLLAMCGVYGVLSYAVAERTTEIGIRLAMGASRRQVLGFVVWKGARIAAVGIGIGVFASLLSTRLLAGLLYGVQSTDPVILSGVALTLLLVATVATLVPAFRASRLDPLTAIRRR